MTLERAFFETTVLREHGRLAPQHVPVVYHFDHPMAITVMQYLEPPHIILRKGLIAGTVYPLLAQHMAEYMASTLFHTSLLVNSTLKHRKAGSLPSQFLQLVLHHILSELCIEKYPELFIRLDPFCTYIPAC